MREEKTTKYKVVLRRPMYTVLFNTDGGTDVESQEVEEGSFANEPEALMEKAERLRTRVGGK